MSVLANILNIFEGPQGIFILLLILLLFGAKKLPELARGMGQALKEFKKAKDEFSDELHKGANDTVTQTNVQPAQSTVPRIENPPPTANDMRPDPNQTTAPGKQADQV